MSQSKINKASMEPGFTDVIDTDSETNEDDEYQDSLVNIEAINDITNDHNTKEDDVYHDTLETMEGLKDLLFGMENSKEPTAKTTEMGAINNKQA